MGRQQELTFRTWGGRRKGAGRKPKAARAGEAHTRRPRVDERIPLHVTMRVSRVPSLRSQRCIAVVRAALRANKRNVGFRIVHYAVQPDHLHFVVEAEGKRALSRGAKAIAIGIAMRLNALLGRVGKVFADRYHAVALGSPRQVRRALAYVLLQARRHAATRGDPMKLALDGCSSAPLFDGWRGEEPRAGPWSDTVVEAKSWLLTTGWRRHGKIDPAEVPGAGKGRRGRGPTGLRGAGPE